MRAELLKARSMPAPRWCWIAVLVTTLLGLAATWHWGLGPDLDAFDLAISFPSSIASTVFGVWLFGLEYGQETMRRSLTADPRRGMLVASKLLTGLLLVVLATVATYLIALPLFDLAAGRHDQAVELAAFGDMVASSLFTNCCLMLVGAAFSMITASMAGGVIFSLVFIFIIGSVVSLIPEVGQYSFNIALTDVETAIRGDSGAFAGTEPEHSGAVAALITAGWLIVLLGVGWLRLARSDVK